MKSLFYIVSLVTYATALPASNSAYGLNDLESRQTCTLTPTNPSTYWYEAITHNGFSPFTPSATSWPVFRNVKTSYGAKGDGSTDDTNAIRNAVNAGNSVADRTSGSLGTTKQPAVVYLPAGTYVLTDYIQLYVGTLLIGDPINPPTLKVSSGFRGSFVIYGKDPHKDSTTSFYIGIKNIIIDSTSFNKDTSLTLLDWSVAQAVQLSNVVFQMPYDSRGHTGLSTPEGGSPIMINDCTFHGGVVGINMNAQQYHLVRLTFNGCTTGIKVNHMFDLVVQGAYFTLCGVAIDTTVRGEIGFVAVIDSKVDNTGALISTTASSTGQDSIVLENVQVDSSVSSTVTASGNVILTGSVPAGQAWVYGNAYLPGGPNTGTHESGTKHSTVRSSVLTDSSRNFRSVKPPTYKEYDVSQFVNVKSVSGLPVAGDGKTDDTANLQHIINDASANCKILFFPYGVYRVTDTLFFPAGSRVFGEGWSIISAYGSRFWDPTKPVPMVKVGNAGDVGVAQFSDLLLTVGDVLQGCTLLEVNIAGATPGDVGFWNVHHRVGGAADSAVETNCGGSGGGGTPQQCKAAFMMTHLTSTSSAYIENMWQWTADHDLDGGNGTVVSVGRGLLVEATKGTWLLGIGSEHNTMYQANFQGAQNVFLGLQQSETAYWQGNGQATIAPDPWSPLALSSDPDFSWCAGGDAQCRMGLYQRISGSSSLSFYGAGFWTFKNNGQDCNGDCQTNGILIENTHGLYYFGINTRAVSTLVRNNGVSLVQSNNNPGGWGAGVAAFLTDSQ